MQEQTKSMSTILINNSKVYADAFTNQFIRLYIPVDEDGKLVAVSEAVRLECWYPGGRNQQIPETTTMSLEGITKSLIKADDDHEFATLSRSVAYGSIAKMETWLRTLHRWKEGDVKSFSIYNKQQ